MPDPPDAVILAGGKGTRLRSVLRDARPKPLASVAGRPFLGWLLRSLQRRGIRRIIVSTGFGAREVEDFVSSERLAEDLALALVCVRESRPLGTGGGLRNALAAVHTPRLLVLNGDSHLPFDLPDLIRRHSQSGARGTLLLTRVADASRSGSVEVDGEGRITAFREKTARPGPGLINAGVYLLQREAVASIPRGQCISLEREVFPDWIGAGLFGVVVPGPFIDIGTPENYALADRHMDWENLTQTTAP
jgi:NDP-sugar pyrophosphorylase family protein